MAGECADARNATLSICTDCKQAPASLLVIVGNVLASCESANAASMSSLAFTPCRFSQRASYACRFVLSKTVRSGDQSMMLLAQSKSAGTRCASVRISVTKLVGSVSLHASAKRTHGVFKLVVSIS
jgi:hypothetical protein